MEYGHKRWIAVLALVLLAAPVSADDETLDYAAKVSARMDRLQQDADFSSAAGDLNGLLAEMIATAPLNDPDPWIAVARARRLVEQLRRGYAEDETAAKVLGFLREHPLLASAMAFTVRPQVDHLPEVYAVFDRLRKVDESAVIDYPSLTAAICVVRDREIEQQVNENKVKAPSVEELFTYYTEHAERMAFSPKDLPPELLMYVVDVAASIDEMNWALKHFRKVKSVGKLFFAIEYDVEHHRSDEPKKVTVEGFSLQNIRKYGGVCADQAYFASTVGKAIGVPACYTWGRGATSSHAWVSFFEAGRRQAGWNLDTGRFSRYNVVRGVLINPQSGDAMADSYLAIQAELVGTSPRQRNAAKAYVDAARFVSVRSKNLDFLDRDPADVDPPKPAEQPDGEVDPFADDPPPAQPPQADGNGKPLDVEDKPRPMDTNTQLLLILHALKQSPGYVDGWKMVSQQAEKGKLTYPQKKFWTENLQKVAGKDYPDFTLAVLKPMIRTVADTHKQNELWNACFRLFRKRHDLAAEVRVAQGEMWDRAGEKAKAGTCYQDVVQRYINAGPFAVDALRRCEQKLVDMGRGKRVPQLYQMAWRRCKRPKKRNIMYMGRSNWLIIGRQFASVLRDHGQTEKADRVEKQINELVGKPAKGQ